MITYQTAKQLKDAGYPQKRKDYSRYYINETTIAYFEDIKNAFEAKNYLEDGREDVSNWLDNFTYIPDLIDFMGIDTYKKTLEGYSQEWLKNNQSSKINEETN